MSMELPASIDEITTDWLGRALSQRHPGTKVEHVEVESTFRGTATKVSFAFDMRHQRICRHAST